MPRQNEKSIKLSIFQRIRLNIQNRRLKNKINRIKSVHKVDVTKDYGVEFKSNFESKRELKEYFKNTSKVVGRENFRFKKLDGYSVREEKYKEMLDKIADINKQRGERKEMIIDHSKEKLDKEVSDAIIRELEMLDSKERTRLSTGTYSDLISLDKNKFMSRLASEEEFELALDNLINNDYYDIGKRDEMYRTNYKKAIIKQYGLNTDTEKLIKIIDNLDINDFILSLYNPYESTQIADIYDPKQVEDYVEFLIEHYSEMV